MFLCLSLLVLVEEESEEEVQELEGEQEETELGAEKEEKELAEEQEEKELEGEAVFVLCFLLFFGVV